MPARPDAPPPGATVQRAGRVEFLSDQEGPGARLLEAEMACELAAVPHVARAYFCKVRYDGTGPVWAAFCLVGPGHVPHRPSLDAVAAAVRRLIGSGSFVDVLFLTAPQEDELSGGCEPFYTRGVPPPAPPNHLYEMFVMVAPGPAANAPPGVEHVAVPCYVAAADPEAAVTAAVTELRAMGHVFEDLLGEQVCQLDPAVWDEHRRRLYGGQADLLPDAVGVRRLLYLGGVAFGPAEAVRP